MMNRSINNIAKRSLRIAFSGLTVLSAVLCIAASALWMRTHFATDYFSHVSRNLYQAASGEDGLYLQKLSYIRRRGQWTLRSIKLPRGPPTHLSNYAETQGNYIEWKGAKIPPSGWTAFAARDWQGFVGRRTPLVTPAGHWPVLTTFSYLRSKTETFRSPKPMTASTLKS